jgi:hypothetical protein
LSRRPSGASLYSPDKSAEGKAAAPAAFDGNLEKRIHSKGRSIAFSWLSCVKMG